MRPSNTEYAPFYEPYMQRVIEEEPLLALEKSVEEIQHFLPLLPDARSDYRYATGKWTVKELLQHVIDTERIMAYRALWIARGDNRPLPGFEEEAYAASANVEYRTLTDLRHEMLAVRKATVCLFDSFDEAAFRQKGVANTYPVSVLALAFIIVGHQRHHFNVLSERYFPDRHLVMS